METNVLKSFIFDYDRTNTYEEYIKANVSGKTVVDCGGGSGILTHLCIENGATKVLPGSQHSKTIPSKEYFDKYSVTVEVPKGSLIIFNARVVHVTGINKTNKWRHALSMNACRPFMKQRMDWVRFIPNEILTQLNQTARRIIGFDTRLPTSLEEFFQPEESRLYKSNQE